MNKIVNIFLSSLLIAAFTACEKDNYDAPDATVEGYVYDHNGDLLETGQGKDNMCIRIKEISYANGDPDVVVIERDLNMMQDGSFLNTKLFGGTYEMWPYQGCFYPVEKEDYKTVELKSGKTTKVEFTVTPYLTLEWIKEPSQDPDGYIRASFRFKRNAKTGHSMPDVESAKLFISTSVKCGNNSDGRYTDNDVTITNTQEGQEIELKSRDKIWYTQPLWVRIGAKCKDADKKYCFTSIKSIEATGFGRN
jgi:hypothetical protein